jgi:hypothetical protein
MEAARVVLVDLERHRYVHGTTPGAGAPRANYTPRMTRRDENRGWGRTLLKCLLTITALAALGALSLWWLLNHLELPWFIPRALIEWIMEHVRPVALAVGAALGALAGLLASVGIVVWDARKGRLSRV